MKDKFTVNIAIIGSISAGKSTLLNSILVNQYSDCMKKRTTMLPQCYIESNDFKDPKLIRETNRKINEGFINEKLTKESCNEVEYQIPLIWNLLTQKQNDIYRIRIYDIPGLNDINTKQIYFDWVKENFYKFDIIIYIIDVNTGMNTDNENEIFKFILEQMNRCISEFGQVKVLIPLVNKCDDIVVNMDEKKIKNCFKFEDDETEQMYNDIYTLFEKQIENYKNTNILINIPIPISTEDSFIYRYCEKTKKHDLDKKYINRVLFNSLGKKYNRLNDDEKLEKFKEIIKEDLTKDINNTGFNYFFKNIQDIIIKYGQQLVQNQIKYQNSVIKSSDINDKPEYFLNIINTLSSLYNNIKLTFGSNSKNIISDKINTSFENLENNLLKLTEFSNFYQKWNEYLNLILNMTNDETKNKYLEKLFIIMLKYLDNCYDNKIGSNNPDDKIINYMMFNIITELYGLFEKYQNNKLKNIKSFYTNIIIELLELKYVGTNYLTYSIYVYNLFKDNFIKFIVGDEYYKNNLGYLLELYLISFYKYVNGSYLNFDQIYYHIYYIEELVNNLISTDINVITQKIKFRSLIHLIKLELTEPLNGGYNDNKHQFNTKKEVGRHYHDYKIDIYKYINMNKEVNLNNLHQIVKDYFLNQYIEINKTNNIEKSLKDYFNK